jgi:hypothetical protein
MRYFLLGVILVLSGATPVRADGGLTGSVAAEWGSRTTDASLHDIAHARVREISACGQCMNHDLMRSGTAEVLGYNAGYADPIETVIESWRTSAVHDGILSDRSYGRIGCAEAVVGGGHYFACVLATGGTWGAGGGGGGTSGGTAVTLPDTAMR